MATRILDIALNTSLAKDVNTFSRRAPIAIDMRNVRYNDLGETVKRPGYTTKWNTGEDQPIVGLIPRQEGYAITDQGNIYVLGDNLNQIYAGAPTHSLPRWDEFSKKIIIVDGGIVKQLNLTDNSVDFLDNLPSAKFVSVINDRAIYSGYKDYEFTVSVSGNLTSIDISFGAKLFNIQKTGTIQNQIAYRENLLIFKEREIEVWNFVGGRLIFSRSPGSEIAKGLGAVNSVVRSSDDRVFWFADDGDFYVLDGFSASIISSNYRAELDKMVTPEDLIGFDIVKEGLIMWTSRNNGKTFLYDYRKNKFLEDSRWEGACWQALPFTSYMELKNKQYFGNANYEDKIFEWGKDYKDDDGLPIRTTKELSIPLSQGGKRGNVRKIRFRREANNATATETAPVFMVRTRMDKGPWTHYEHLSLGVKGDNDPHIEMRNRGIGREMDMDIVQTSATDFRVTNAYVYVTELRN